jgi:hypothetical protein
LGIGFFLGHNNYETEAAARNWKELDHPRRFPYMAFDRTEFGMNSGIPFIKIADRVEVTVDLHGK